MSEMDKSEMDKLEEYLKSHGYDYTRAEHQTHIPGPTGVTVCLDDQIVVYKNGLKKWDVICGAYSYGGNEGLLEAMGKPIVKKTDSEGESGVVGWLTAEDVIARLEGKS